MLLFACSLCKFRFLLLRLATEQRHAKESAFGKWYLLWKCAYIPTHICMHTRCRRKMATRMLEQPFSINHLQAKRYCLCERICRPFVRPERRRSPCFPLNRHVFRQSNVNQRHKWKHLFLSEGRRMWWNWRIIWFCLLKMKYATAKTTEKEQQDIIKWGGSGVLCGSRMSIP